MPFRFDPVTLRKQAADIPSMFLGLVGTPRRAAPPTATAAKDSHAGLFERLAGLGPREAERVLAELVQAHAAAVLGDNSPSAIGIEKPFKDNGFGSLTSIELRNRLVAAIGLRLSATLVFDYPSAADLAVHLREQLLPETEPESDRSDGESWLRDVFAQIPVQRLRMAGLLDTLMGLAGIKGMDQFLVVDDADIDEMDAGDLIDMLTFDDE